jgi:hypothetical protein
VRTPLERLDIGEDVRKRLREGGIVDVEGVVEAGELQLIQNRGDRSTAARVLALAQALLKQQSPTPPPKPTPKPAPLPKKSGRGKK